MKRIMFVAALLMALTSINAEAKMKFNKEFKAAYPKSAIAGYCAVCHVSEDEPTDLNSYGQDWQDNGSNFKAIEAKDSDGDGKTNIAEINAGTHPGDASN